MQLFWIYTFENLAYKYRRAERNPRGLGQVRELGQNLSEGVISDANNKNGGSRWPHSERWSHVRSHGVIYNPDELKPRG